MHKNPVSGKVVLSSVAALLLSGAIMTQATPVHANGHAKFGKAGELSRPANYREWIFIGAPVTPNDMNDGKPAFPEFHNTYIDHKSWAHWKKTGEFREGTMIAKELVSVGTKKSASGNGYFPGDMVGPVAVSVKDSKRFAKDGNWGYFVFGDAKHKLLRPRLVMPVLPAIRPMLHRIWSLPSIIRFCAYPAPRSNAG